MQGKFSEYFNLNFDELDEVLMNKKTLFIFDTNVLLSAYETHPKTSKTILNCIDYVSVSSQVWMPYQIGFEFHKNRLGIKQKNIKGLQTKIDDIKSNFRSIKNNLNASYFKAKHVLDPVEVDNVDTISKKLSDTENDVLEFLEERKKSLIAYWNQQSILSKLNSIFTDEKIGEFLGAEKIQSFCQQADELWQKGIGVGHCDKGKEVTSHYTNDFSIADKYGDFIYVCEIKEYLKSTNLNESKYDYLVIVTNEQKKDFWHGMSEEASIPQPYLKRDLLEGTNIKDFILLETPVFLKKIMPKLDVETNTQNAVLEEVKSNINKHYIVKIDKPSIADSEIENLLLDLKTNNKKRFNENQDMFEIQIPYDSDELPTEEFLEDAATQFQNALDDLRSFFLEKKLRQCATLYEFDKYCKSSEVSHSERLHLNMYLHEKYGFGINGYFKDKMKE